MPERLRVAVRSPQHVVLAGLSALLARHPDRFEVVRPPRRNDHDEPDVVLYDVLLLLDDDERELDHLVNHTVTKVLAVSRDLRPDLVSRALAAGADGFFSIGVSEDELVAAVESARTGCAEGERGASRIIGSETSAARAARLGADVGLTERETAVLALIAQGLSNQQIATRLYLSINSVKTYIRLAYRRIGVTSRGQAVSWAIRHGFDPGHEPQDDADRSSAP